MKTIRRALLTLTLAAFTACLAQAQQTGNEKEFSFSQESATGIELLSFTAVYKEKVYMNWTARDAAGEGAYLVERSTDGSNYIKIGVKRAAISPASQALLFSFTDERPVTGTSFYRVTWVSGKNFFASPVIKISVSTEDIAHN